MSDQPAMTCARAREALETLTAARPEIPPGNVDFHQHLEQCPDCRALYAEAVAQTRLLDAWAAPPPRGNVQARVMAAIAREERQLRERREQRHWPGRLFDALAARIRIPAAAAFGVALLLLISLGANAVLLVLRGAPDLQRPGSSQPSIITAMLPSSGNPAATTLPVAIGSKAIQIFPGNSLGALSPSLQDAGVLPLGVIVVLGAPPMRGSNLELKPTI